MKERKKMPKRAKKLTNATKENKIFGTIIITIIRYYIPCTLYLWIELTK